MYAVFPAARQNDITDSEGDFLYFLSTLQGRYFLHFHFSWIGTFSFYTRIFASTCTFATSAVYVKNQNNGG